MKSKLTPLLAAMALYTGLSTTANAAIMLFDYGFNLDGDISLPLLGDPIPAGIDVSGFDDLTGLGTIDISITGAGAHSFDAFFDHEIDEPINSYFNETGAVSGTPSAGQSWEIDEPGFAGDDGVTGSLGIPYYGDIYGNFSDSALDNLIFFDAFDNQSLAQPDDVSMAMGWDFSLALGDQALISIILGTMMPTDGFFLEHRDPDSLDALGNPTSVYLSSTLKVSPIPVPAAIWLFGSGLIGLVAFGRRRQARNN